MAEGLKKTRECLHCEHLFKCKGKPLNVDKCLNFEERKKEDGRTQNVRKVDSVE